MNQKTTNMNDLHTARKKLLKWQPQALYVRLEGRCPDCKRVGGFVSYQLPEDMDATSPVNEEPCGYYCSKCDWSAAGAREVSEE